MTAGGLNFQSRKVGRYRYTLVGEEDHFETWQSDLKKRVEAKQDLAVPFATGALLLEQVQTPGNERRQRKAGRLGQEARGSSDSTTVEFALQDELLAMVHRYPDPALETWYERELEIVVDRERAGFSAWYELFPAFLVNHPGKARHPARRGQTDGLCGGNGL